MLRMQIWQYAVVGSVALPCLAGMSWTVVRMFARRAAAPATLREATAFESAAACATAPTGARAFDGWAYRVPARVAGRLRLVVDAGLVSIAGPRVPSWLYQMWIWVQALILALVPAAFVAAAVRLDWRWVLVGAGVFLLSLGVSGMGAGLWPGLGEMEWLAAGRFKAVEFPVGAVSDVKVGAGWADGGIDLVLLPYKGPIDMMSRDHAVSFWGPDEDGREVRYAVMLPDTSDATALAALLRNDR
jgi:hypothetical protein